MRFKVTLTDETSEVLGQYNIEIVKKLADLNTKEELEDTVIEESDFNSPHSMDFHIRSLGEMILNDVEAIYLQRIIKWR